MQRLAVEAEAVVDTGQAAGHKRVDTEKDMCDRKGLAVEGDAGDARLGGSWKEAVDMGSWMPEVVEQDHNEQSGSCQGLRVEDQAVSVVKKHMGSDGLQCVCLAPRDKVAEDFSGMVRDEKFASHFDAYHGPSVTIGHTIRDDTQGSHWRRTQPATQRKGVEDRKQELLRAYRTDHSRHSGTPSTEAFP